MQISVSNVIVVRIVPLLSVVRIVMYVRSPHPFMFPVSVHSLGQQYAIQVRVHAIFLVSCFTQSLLIG